MRVLFLKAFVLVAVAAVGAPAQALGQPMPVPVKIQVAILKKAVAYDKSLGAKPSLKVLVVGGSKAQTDEVLGAFREIGIEGGAAKAEEVAAKSDDRTVVYVLPGGSNAALKKLLAEKNVLSISGAPSLAESGEVSLAVGLRADGRPELVVNLAELKAEGHEFSAEMLKLAKVVR